MCKNGDNIIIFNARTNALAKLSLDEYEQLKKCDLDTKSTITKELKESLVYGGYLLEDKTNELDIIKNNVLASRFSNNILNLTIAPTSNCNFRCPYCFEKDVLRPGKMVDSTVNDIYKFIEKEMSHLEAVNITWYGGEPLLEMETICTLSKRIIELCKLNNVRYFASIITNGYLLTKEVMVKLIDCKIKNIQITLDGPKKYHDNRRYLIGKKPTFDRILNNIKDFGDISSNRNFPFISVRMNVDKNNIDGVNELKKLMTDAPYNRYINFYIAAVYDKSDAYNTYTYTSKEFKEIESSLKSEKFNDYKQYYPESMSTHCVCDTLTGLVIDADGSLYKCWEEMGDSEYCIGNISDFKYYSMNHIYYDYMLYNPLENKKCKNCSVLPICMGGGCLHRILRDGYNPDCDYIRKNIQKNIEKSYILMNNI